MKKISLIILSVFLLSSCALLNQGGNSSQLDYLDKGAKFDIKKFFNGKLEAFAITQDNNGKIIDTQSIKIEGSWEDDKGVIKQNFVLASGSKDNRTWLITVDENSSSFTAIGHDIAAPAQGKQAGNAMQMNYSLLLPGQVPGQKSKVNFEDKIYLVSDSAAIMISTSSSGFGSSKKSIISLKKLSEKTPEKAPEKISVKTDE